MQTKDASVYAEFARGLWQREGEVEIDPNAPVNASTGDDKRTQGAYVQSWIYVSNDIIACDMVCRLVDAGVSCEDLDDLVHTAAEGSVACDTESADDDFDAASKLASDANNAGLPDQCLFLIEHLGAGGANELVTRLIGARSQQRARTSETP